MTDICKCKNTNCSIREHCYRFRAAASEYQAYFIVKKVVNTKEDCDEYWEVTDDATVEKLDKYWAD